MLLEEVGKVIAPGGTGVTISSQSGHRMPALGAEIDRQLACTPTKELLSLEVLQPQNIKDTLHAYQLAKRCNVKRVMAEAVKWGERGARINSISPGIIVTPLGLLLLRSVAAVNQGASKFSSGCAIKAWPFFCVCFFFLLGPGAGACRRDDET